jgi:hypothetical protein
VGCHGEAQASLDEVDGGLGKRRARLGRLEMYLVASCGNLAKPSAWLAELEG